MFQRQELSFARLFVSVCLLLLTRKSNPILFSVMDLTDFDARTDPEEIFDRVEK